MTNKELYNRVMQEIQKSFHYLIWSYYTDFTQAKKYEDNINK